MPREHVDRAVRAVDGVGHLDLNFPAEVGEKAPDRARETSVVVIEQSVELAAAPAKVDHEPRLERCHDGDDVLEQHPVRVPTFDERDQGLRHARRQGKVKLAPASAAAQGADDDAEAHQIHRRTMTEADHLRLIRSRVATAQMATCGAKLGQTTGTTSEEQTRWPR